MIIKSTEDYELRVAVNPHGTKYYSIFNTVTGVEELGESKEMLLPQAYDYLDQMQSHLDGLRKPAKATERSVTLNG